MSETPDVADAFEPGQWSFTPAVVEQFDGHVRASVPFYDAIQQTVAETADWLAPNGSTVADLGCSTGTTILEIADRQKGRQHQFYAYDESEEMLAAARVKLAEISDVEYYAATLGDADGFAHRNASLTLALFTLQFLSPEQRGRLLWAAREASTRDGAILIAEKVRPADPRWAEIAAEVSWDYKSDQGISADSVLAKSRALRGVLRPQTEAANLTELADAGWQGSTVLFRWHQWSLYGAFAS